MSRKEDAAGFRTLARVHEEHGPQMRAWCPGCDRQRWIEVGRSHCRRCVAERRRARMRGNVALLVAAFLILTLAATASMPDLVRVYGAFVGTLACALGWYRIVK
jgi:uncharacterized paraquat-inducible protein A